MSDPRYYGRSEARRLAPDRTSKDYGVSERRSAEKVGTGGVIPISTETFVTPPTSTSTSTRSSAYSGSIGGAYAGRPRRNTLDIDGVSDAQSKPRTVVMHQQATPRPNSPLSRSAGLSRSSYDYQEPAYVTTMSRGSQPKREHKRLYSVDDSGHAQSVHNLPAAAADPHVRNMDSWGGDDRRERDLRKEKRDHPRERERQYHLSGSSTSKPRNIDEAYGYTDAAGMFRDTEPRWRSRRGSADARNRDRPISLLDSGTGEYSNYRSSRDMGPPPTIRGLQKINQGLERGGSVRDTRETRGSSRERRESDAPRFLGIDRAATFDMPARPSSTRPPVESDSRNQHRLPADQRYDSRGDPYDERGFREPSREPRPLERQFTDQNLESRGFGIRMGSVDHGDSSREESRDRLKIYPGGPPIIAGDRAPSISDYAPSHAQDDASRHHGRRASERGDYYSERPRDRYRPDDDYDDDRPRPQHDSRHGSLAPGDGHASRHGSVQAGLGVAAGAAGLGLGAYAGKKAADDRAKERRYEEEDEQDRAPRRGPRDDPRDRDLDRERDSDRDRDRERNREKERERERRRQQEEDFEREREREQRDRQRPRDREFSPEDKPLAIEDAKPSAEQPLDPDEEYRRRVQQAAAELASVSAPLSRETTRDDDYRSRRDLGSESGYGRRGRDDGGAGLPPRGSKDGLAPPGPSITSTVSMPALGAADRVQPPPAPVSDFEPPQPRDDQRSRQEGFFADSPMTQEPTELFLPPAPSTAQQFPERSDARSVSPGRSPSRETRVRIVEPPKDEKESPPLRGILKKPKERFPEDPHPVREGVTTTKDPKRDQKARKEGIPSDARWTKIDRSWVNPQALEEAGERFEERMDCVIVLRVLTKDEIQKYADRTRQIRDEREGRHSSRRKHGDDDDPDRHGAKDRGHDRDDRKRSGGRRDRDNHYDSSDEEYERNKREYADLERSLRKEKEKPKQIEMANER